MKKKPNLYFNLVTGSLISVSKKVGRMLGPDYKHLRFVTNEKGVEVMRFDLQDPKTGGTVTVDIMENEMPPVVETPVEA